MIKISYSGYRFPPKIIQHAIWLYLRFTLSFRDVEDLLAERGIMVSYETVRRKCSPISGARHADVTGVGASVPSCRGFGIAKILKKRQLYPRHGRHPADVGYHTIFWKISRARAAIRSPLFFSHAAPKEVLMAKYDVTKTNDGIDRLLAVTTNPRHRFMLQAYYRHRFLEIAGRYDEIFVPEMTVENPVYHVHASGQHTKLEGRDAVKNLYRMWADTNQAIFYVENEQVAVADNYIASTSIYHQQLSGGSLMFNKAMSYLPGFFSERIVKRVLEAKAVKPDENAMYLYTNFLEMIWPYDDRGRLIGEDVWEPDPDKAEIIKLDPEDVLTTQQAATLLAPLIKPLPSS